MTGKRRIDLRSDDEGGPFLSYDRIDKHGAGLVTDPIERLVVVLRIMVEQHKLLDLGRLRDAHAFLPGRMSPADVTREFVVGKIAVVDHEVNAVDEPEDVAIELAGTMLGVGDVCDR